MKLRDWLLLSAVASNAALLIACSSEERSCRTTRTCPPGGAGGNGAKGDAGAAGELGGGDEYGGGRGGNGAAGNEDAGSAGEGGEGGAFAAGPVLFGGCSVKGAFACVEHASAQRLACDGERWQAGTTCAADRLCDSSNGKCAPIIPECAATKPGTIFCREDARLACGVDLVTASEVETCAGRCKQGKCEAPTCGDEKVEWGEDCDDAASVTSGACVKCKTARCGDGAVYAGHEQCDDGNLVSGDGCSATCRAEPVQLALGDGFTCALSSTGIVKCWGNNDVGQLGIGKVDNRGGTAATLPSKFDGIDLGSGQKAVSISARGSSACARLNNGQVKCWGKNSFGQLGTGDTDHRGDAPGEMGDALKPVPIGAEARAISAGGDHTCVLLAAGTVKCWGSHAYGQLGQGNAVDVLSPKDLAPIKLQLPAVSISAASFISSGWAGNLGGATCALLNNGKVQCWGYDGVVPHTSTSDIDGSSGIGDFAGEMDALPALTFEGDRPAQSMVAGNASAVILSDGSLRLWGFFFNDNNPAFYGMSPPELATLPAVQTGKKVVSVATNTRHAYAILEDGALKCWGRSDSGELGLGSMLSTLGAPKDLPSVDLGGHAAAQVATGPTHTCAILDDGTLKCWGSNNYGQLGLGDTNNRGDNGDKLGDDTTVSLSF